MERAVDFVDPMTGDAPFHRDVKSSLPDMIFITADMVPPGFWREGPLSDIVHTPNLDSLASEGVRFENCFATSPVCAPSRGAYLTGRHSYITTNNERGHDGHQFHLRSDDTIFPEYLRAIGYHTRHVGKSHVGTERFLAAFGENDSPWDRWYPPWYEDEAYIRYLDRMGLEPFEFSRSIVGVHPSGNGDGNFYGGWIASQQGQPFPTEATYPWFLAERAIDALQARRKVAPDAPLYLQLDFFAPHQPFAIPGDMQTREREVRERIRLSDSYQKLKDNAFKPDWSEPRIYTLYRKNWGIYDAEVAIDYMVANVLQYEIIDRVVGHVLKHLHEQEAYDETNIIYTADHGEMNTDLGLIDKGAFLNPRVLRVPLYVKPALDSKGAVMSGSCEKLVSLLDIAPTILELAGIKPFARLDGQSLLATVKGESRPADVPILSEIWSHVLPSPAVSIVFTANNGENFLFAFNTTDRVSELYRLQEVDNDDAELTNLFLKDDPESTGIRQEAISTMESVLSSDERWKGYLSFFRLVFAEHLCDSHWNTQRFS